MTWENLKQQAKAELSELVEPMHSSVVVALSGGKDSMTALQLVSECQAELTAPVELRALHVAYGLRGEESAAEASFVARHCRERGIALEVIEAGPAPLAGIQEWARELRLALYRERIAAGAIIVTGHHRDDLAETVLLRLARGSHPAGLNAMTSWRHGIWRPLLAVDRATIDEWAVRKNLPFRHDSSNDKLEYSRNRVRHQVLPGLEQVHRGAAGHIVALAESCDQLSAFAEDSLIITLESCDYRPSIRWLISLPRAVATLVLGLMITRATPSRPRAHQPGHTVTAFLSGLSALAGLSPSDPVPPRPRVALAGGGYLTVVPDGDELRAAFAAEDDEPFGDIHARHARNLALKPLAALTPKGGQIKPISG